LASGPYKPVLFVDSEAIDRDKMNQVANNMQWLFENTPRIKYAAHGFVKASGAKILAGIATVPATNTTFSQTTVYFGSFFSQGCQPVITATPIRNTSRARFEVIVKGIGRVYPDHRGAQIAVMTDEYNATINKHITSLPVSWIAIGW
jgi:hypothetical protein